MEKLQTNYLYVGAVKETEVQKNSHTGRERKRLMKEGVSIQQCGGGLPYFLWEGRRKTARVQLYTALLPICWRGSFGRERKLKKEEAAVIIEKTAERAWEKLHCREILLEPLPLENPSQQSAGPLAGKLLSAGLGTMELLPSEALPIELLAVCLYRQRPFDRVGIYLPYREMGEAQQAMWLLLPYLSRLRQVRLFGEPSEEGLALSQRLYQEFGLAAGYEPLPFGRMKSENGVQSGKAEIAGCVQEEGKEEGFGKKVQPMENMVILDLRTGAEGEKIRTEQNLWKRHGIRCVNRAETLKFLDTIVKNRYNTEVN